MKRILLLLSILLCTQVLSSQDMVFDELKSAILEDNIELLIQRFKEGLSPELIHHETSESLFLIAMESQKVRIVELFLQNGKDPNVSAHRHAKSLLYLSTQAENDAITDLLLKYGADPLVQEPSLEGVSSSLLSLATGERNNRFIKMCLEQNAAKKYHSIFALEPLAIEAIRSSNYEAMKMFIEYGADISEVSMSYEYKTMLAIAMEKHGKQSRYVKLLEAKGADTLQYVFKTPLQGFSTVDRLRIRKKPALDGEVLGHLMKGDVVDLLEVTPLSYKIDNMNHPWLKIRKNELEGWVYAGYIEPRLEHQGMGM